MRLRSVDLGYTGTGSSLVLKDSKHAVGAVWRAVELLFEDLENSLVGDLGCIVEELGESALEGTGKKRSIGSNGLACNAIKWEITTRFIHHAPILMYRPPFVVSR
jgi:hypothetical protein